MLTNLNESQVLNSIAKAFPTSLPTLKALLGLKCNGFDIYSVCPKCYAIYKKEHCTKTLPDGRVVTKTCSNVLWPNHPHLEKRTLCGKMLMKKIRGKSGNIFWYPKKVYVYQSIVASLQKFINKDNFIENCNEWRKRVRLETASHMTDIHDEEIWKAFQTYEGKPFLKDPNNMALILNVDWFNPYKDTPGSVGAIYCVFANLPRSERYKRENVMLVGLVEGEPKHDMNSVLKKAVNELLTLWIGSWFSQGIRKIFVRVALLCIACDVPAARKVVGFMAHNATRGCSRCLKTFPVSKFGEKPGFDCESWTKRDASTHQKCAFDTLEATSSSRRQQLESKFGTRYTELLCLPYYDCVRFVVVDPMHNLLLGTAKHMFHKWIEDGLLKQPDLKKIQEHVDELVVPNDVGRIPNKIEAGCSGITADQWKNWTLIFSSYILSTILAKEHYDCWMLFVNAICECLQDYLRKNNFA